MTYGILLSSIVMNAPNTSQSKSKYDKKSDAPKGDIVGTTLHPFVHQGTEGSTPSNSAVLQSCEGPIGVEACYGDRVGELSRLQLSVQLLCFPTLIAEHFVSCVLWERVMGR